VYYICLYWPPDLSFSLSVEENARDKVSQLIGAFLFCIYANNILIQ